MKYSQFNHVTPIPNTSYCVLTNFWSGHFIRLNPFQKKLFDLAMDLPQDHPLVLRWKQAGFLTDRDEIGMIREHIREYYSEMDRSTDKVFRLMLHVTSACNYACPYCFQDRRGGEMSREVQDAIVRYIRLRFSTGRYRKLTVGWFGGEPLLASEVIKSLGKRIREVTDEFGAELFTSVYTNGYLLDQDTVDMLEEVNCGWALITVDGVGPLHDATRHLQGGGGTYDRIIENLSHIRTKMTVCIRSNLSAENYPSYDELCRVIGEIAAKTGNTMLLKPMRVYRAPASEKRGDKTEPIPEELYAQIAKKTDMFERMHYLGRRLGSCRIFETDRFVVDELGNVFLYCDDYAVDPHRAYGNILDLDGSGIEELDRKHREFCLKEILPLSHAKCMACSKLPLCFGGCLIPRITGKKEPVCPDALYDVDTYVLRKYAKLCEESQ